MKKRIALLLSFVLVLSTILMGCSSGSKNEDAGNADKGTTSNEVVTLKWVTLGNGMPTNYEAWLAQINPYLEEKIGVNVDMEVVSWGDWANRRNVLINSGEYFDILFTDGGSLPSDVALGAYYDIKDLLKTNAPDLYEYIPADYWETVTIKDGVYAVPTYKDSSLTNYIVWDIAMAEKYNIDYKNIHTLEGLTEPLKAITEGEGTAAFNLSKNGLGSILSLYDGMGASLPAIGVRYDDETRTVVNVLEQDDVMSSLATLHEWFKAGIINPDAPTLDTAPTYSAVNIAQGWPSAAKTTWGPNMGAEAEAVQFTETIVSNETVRGSLNAVYSGTKYPEKCVELLQLINLDSKVRDAFYYGVEGENFNYTEDGKVERINAEWPMAGYTQATFFTISQLATDELNQWDEVKALNESATPSVLLGFSMDISSIQNELANCREIFEKYRSELLTGSADPTVLVPQITKELNAAGFERIMTEAQAQVDAFYQQ